ncbi:threonine synthase [Candidatus Peregrinibacteria bacterium]|nr:MAG: threonine synthase [Candidatus Peregrinibacteria bacterium]
MTKRQNYGRMPMMIHYVSTRGGGAPVSFSEAVLCGLAPDGGLFSSESTPKISEKQMVDWLKKPYAELAAEILALFAPEIPQENIQHFCRSAYAPEKFSHADIAPVTSLGKNRFLLELFHGPTGAFKDFALQLLPHIISYAITQGDGLHRAILVATSGDTGGAALSGFADVTNTSCVVFFPEDGVSPLQEAQMRGAEGENVLSLGIRGSFDTAQSAVKEIFLDTSFCQMLRRQNILLSSANSINIGRLIPQIVYAVHGYLQLISLYNIPLGNTVDVTIPTGNFGDIFAVFLAKKMGIPFGKLMCANNENSSTTQFLKSGIFNISGQFTKKTLAPAMDILKASNIERLLFFLADHNSEKVKTWISEREGFRKFLLSTEEHKKIQEDFLAETVSDAEILSEIRKSTDEFGKTPDPHTAVGIVAARRNASKNPMLIFSTAHWAKFGETIWKALLPEKDIPKTEEEILLRLAEVIQRPPLPNALKHIFQKKTRHSKTISGTTDDMKHALLNFFEKQS